ncbi:MAG: TatD family hydrolase [Promethearchaeota archaeon]
MISNVHDLTMFDHSTHQSYSGEKIDLVHSIYRTVGDIKMFRHMGIRDLISVLILPFTPTSAESFNDFFSWYCDIEIKRWKKHFVRIHPVLGMPPARKLKSKIIDSGLGFLEDYIKSKKVIGIGEIGMGFGTKDEYMQMKRQLALASKYDLPVIVQAPTINKVALTSIILKEISKAKVSRAIINHCDMEIVELVLRTPNTNIKAGITVGQQAISPEEAFNIFKTYSRADRIVLNSSLGYKDSSLFGLTNTIELFEEENIDEEFLQRMYYGNYLDVFPSLSTRIKLMLG